MSGVASAHDGGFGDAREKGKRLFLRLDLDKPYPMNYGLIGTPDGGETGRPARCRLGLHPAEFYTANGHLDPSTLQGNSITDLTGQGWILQKAWDNDPSACKVFRLEHPGKYNQILAGRRADAQWLFCLEAKSGKEVWATLLGKMYLNEFGDGPRSTPTVTGGRVFVIGANGEVLCADAETGKEHWSVRPREWADEWRTGRDINGEWATIMECLGRVADSKPGGQGRWNNPDYLMVGFVGDEEAKSQMSLWCVTAAPLYVSHDFRALNDWDRYVLLNTEAIAVDQDPAGTPGSRVKVEGAAQVWARRLADGSTALVLLNAGEKPLAVGVTWAELKLTPGPRQVRDLWAHENFGEQASGYRATNLPPHGCAFLRVSPAGRLAPAPAATWAPNPGKRPTCRPLDPAGWTFSTTFPRKDDPLKNILDGDPKTGFWSYASPGHYLQIDFGKPTTFDRVVIDHKGVGPNPWSYVVYAPQSTYALLLPHCPGCARGLGSSDTAG